MPSESRNMEQTGDGRPAPPSPVVLCDLGGFARDNWRFMLTRDAIDMDKAHFRRLMHRQRLALTSREVSEMGNAVRRRLLGMDIYGQARCISSYISVKNEVDTHGLIQATLEGGKCIGVPLTGKGGQMRHCRIASLSELKPAAFGLLEPSPEAEEIQAEAFDLILVPGLAFDREGNRIGFGAGYYDRFLARTNAPKVGLAYDSQILHHLPSDPHDIRMDFLVTETGVCVCNKSEAP